MRFKNQVLDGLVQAQNIGQKIQFQINRNVEQQDILDSVDQLKEQIENIKDLIGVEHDEFS
jgi:cell shape-determining protein MreC